MSTEKNDLIISKGYEKETERSQWNIMLYNANSTSIK